MADSLKLSIKYIYYFFYASIVLGIAFHWGTIYPYKISLLLILSYFIFYILFDRDYKYIISKFLSTLHTTFIFYFFILYYILSYFWLEYDVVLYKLYVINSLKCILIGLFLVYYIDSFEKLKKSFFILSIIFIIQIFFGLLQIHPEIYMSNSKINYPSSIPTGFSYNQNDFGYVLGLIFPFILFFANNYLRIILGSFILILIIQIGSIVALVSFISSAILYLLFIKKTYKTFLLILLTVSILFFTNTYKSIFPVNIVHKIDNFDKVINLFNYSEDAIRTGSAQHKYEVNNIILDSLDRTNYLGLGAGQSLKELENNQEKLGEKNFSVHNFWIEMLADAGLFFTIIFFIWYLSMIVKLSLIYYKETESFFKNFSGALALSFIIFFISSMSPSSVFHIYITWLLFGMGAVVLNLNKNLNSIKNIK